MDDQITADNQMMWSNAGWTIVTRAFGLTVTLGVGWIVHALLLREAL